MLDDVNQLLKECSFVEKPIGFDEEDEEWELDEEEELDEEWELDEEEELDEEWELDEEEDLDGEVELDEEKTPVRHDVGGKRCK